MVWNWRGSVHVACAGDEFYIREWPQLVGRSFQEVLLSFPLALPVGLKIAATGEVKLNPDDSYIMADGLCHHLSNPVQLPGNPPFIHWLWLWYALG